MSQNSSPIEKVYIVGVEQCNATGAVLRLSVRGHSVEAVFDAEQNHQVLPKIKSVLLNTGAFGFLNNGKEIPTNFS